MTGRSRDESPRPDTDRVASRTARLRLQRGALVVVDGPGAGRRAVLEVASLVIGSDPATDFQLEGRSVSRRHAELSAHGGRFRLRDLGSTNGTFINGNQIGEAYLNPGDLVMLGACRLRFEEAVEEVRVPPSPSDRFEGMYGGSLAMRALFGVLARVAPTEAAVLLEGETGTGKDMAARAIHGASSRASGPFVVFDCSAVTPELVASELFGHVEGAFTGAVARRAGAFAAASGGTLLLDEIGELPLDVQPKLLRALEAREVRPLGTDRRVSVDVRVVSATHRDLFAMTRDARFREDLYYRIAVVRIELPPLRRRREDIPGLVDRLVRELSGSPVEVDTDAMRLLAAQEWPGNVRELRNVLHRTLALSAGGVVRAADLHLTGREAPGAVEALCADSSSKTLEAVEREAILRALDDAGGILTEAARRLGVHRNTLGRKLRRFGLKHR